MFTGMLFMTCCRNHCNFSLFQFHLPWNYAFTLQKFQQYVEIFHVRELDQRSLKMVLNVMNVKMYFTRKLLQFLINDCMTIAPLKDENWNLFTFDWQRHTRSLQYFGGWTLLSPSAEMREDIAIKEMVNHAHFYISTQCLWIKTYILIKWDTDKNRSMQMFGALLSSICC